MLATQMTDDRPDAPHEHATILVVDDDAEVREIVAEFLADAGHHVLQADGGLAALRVIEEAGSSISSSPTCVCRTSRGSISRNGSRGTTTILR